LKKGERSGKEKRKKSLLKKQRTDAPRHGPGRRGVKRKLKTKVQREGSQGMQKQRRERMARGEERGENNKGEEVER